MKRKLVSTILLGAMMAGVFSAFNIPTDAYALVAGTKTAVLNNAQISFADGEVQTIQCYNIDGYNYVRARDITNGINVEVQPLLNGETGIMVIPDETPSVSSTMESLTISTAVVNLQKGMIYYDSTGYETDCFLFNDRYYFKLADFAAASDNSLDGTAELTIIQAKGGIATEPSKKEFIGMSVEWKEETKTIYINREEVNLQKIFEEVKNGGTVNIDNATTVNNSHPTSVNTSISDIKTETNTNSKEYVGTGVLTSAPTEGKILANILIDESIGAYKDNAMTQINYDNLTKSYSKSHLGGCNWYVEGRLAEVYGSSFSSIFYKGESTKDWVEVAKSGVYTNINGTSDKKEIVSGCIAVWTGHVVFVEYVEYDTSGNPTTIYFTESNYGHKTNGLESGVYYPDYDCKVKVAPFDEVISRSNSFVGYVIVK